ncbi:MAG: glycosyltransferase family 4 protein [Acidobacteria bacterium]|nr:glycosyltransferase family 4 protein [Acidobacteriota bacterium]MBS1867184.1 glycosyltransferase family 4 protein [Acidobacteriota bacterium]
MKILFVDLDREWRGGQSQALLTVAGLRACGHDAQLLAVRACPLAKRAEAAGVPVHAIGPRGRRIAAARLLRSLLTKGKYDLAHVNEPHALTAAWLACAQTTAPVIASRRVAYPIKQSRLALKRYLATSRILAISRFVEQSLVDSGISAEKIEVVYEGVEVPARVAEHDRASARQRWGTRNEDLLIGCVGYLLPEKGQEHLVKAFREVHERFPKARLLLAGDGPCRKTLELLARSLGIQDAIVFAGFVEDIKQVYAALDIFAFPSLAEPLGTSLLAAMAWGLPVVAVASGGVPEYVEDDVTGLLVAQAEPKLLSEALLRMFGEKSLRDRLGEQARRKIEEKLSASRMVDNTIQAYERVLKI